MIGDEFRGIGPVSVLTILQRKLTIQIYRHGGGAAFGGGKR